jgi:hypothetical protein
VEALPSKCRSSNRAAAVYLRQCATPAHTRFGLQEDLAAGTSLQLEASIDNVKAGLRDLDLRLEQQVEDAAAGHASNHSRSSQSGRCP